MGLTNPSSLPTKTVILPFHLPDNGARLLVSPGQTVTPGQTLATWRTHTQIPLEIHRVLSIPPQQIFNYLKRDLGELIHQGEIIASRKTIFGDKQFISPQTGTLHLTSHQQLVIQASGEHFQITSPVSAQVKEVSARQITLQTRGIQILGQWGIGNQAYGQLVAINQQSLSDLTSGRLESNLSNKLVVADFPIERTTYLQLNALDIAGLFCCQIDPQLKVDLFHASPQHRLQAVVELGVNQDFDFHLVDQSTGWLFGDEKRLLIFDQ